MIDRRFAVAAVNLWNQLPDSVTIAKTQPQYKTLNIFRGSFYFMLMGTFLHAFYYYFIITNIHLFIFILYK